VSTFAIVNPASDNGMTAKRWRKILAVLEEKVPGLEWKFTEGPGHATEIAREALHAGATRVVSVGGDGTNNEVANGFFESSRSVNEKAVLCMLPSGTACDFAKVLSIPKNIEAATDVLVNGRAKSCDLGKASFRSHDGNTVERYFLNVADVGIGGETVARVNRTTKAFGPLVSYLYGFLVTLFKYKNKPMKLTVDDKDLGNRIVKSIAISNGRCCGGGIQVAPEASIDDGLFDILIVGNMGYMDTLRHFPKLYTGKPIVHRDVKMMRGRYVSATSPEEALIDFDGEQPGTLPATFEIIPGGIKVLVPAGRTVGERDHGDV
jgi:diacylglycerol kinase (ATP)